MEKEFSFESRGAPEEQGSLNAAEQIKKLNIEDGPGIREMIELIKTNSIRLDKHNFKQIKEEIRGENQLIPPEKDIAFLDEISGTIYINSDIAPETSINEIEEHEASEMTQKILLGIEKSDISQKDQWRLAHTTALKNEYGLAAENNHLDAHHKWIIDYLEGLKGYKDEEEFQLAIQRQIEEREQIYKELLTN